MGDIGDNRRLRSANRAGRLLLGSRNIGQAHAMVASGCATTICQYGHQRLHLVHAVSGLTWFQQVSRVVVGFIGYDVLLYPQIKEIVMRLRVGPTFCQSTNVKVLVGESSTTALS